MGHPPMGWGIGLPVMHCSWESSAVKMSSPQTQALNLTLPRDKQSPELTQGERQSCTALMCYLVGLHSAVVLPILRERGESAYISSINLLLFAWVVPW